MIRPFTASTSAVKRLLALLLLLWGGMGCAPSGSAPTPTLAPPTAALVAVVPTLTPTLTPSPTATRTSTATAVATLPPPATPTPLPTATAIPSPTPTDTPSPTPTATPAPLCTNRLPSPDDLLVIVTGIYGLSPQYQPPDIVPLSDFFGPDVTKGYPSQIRLIIAEPLQRLIGDMQAEGLRPQIISGYRSYSSQAIAFQKWADREPERVSMLSARPGHSEHQLGTTVDFGSPTLYQYVEDAEPTLEFHTYFFKTPEGVWLLANAHRYGFTLSYPREAQGVTGFYYEPWHYRYVGVEMATMLKENSISLTEYLLVNNPNPCELNE